MRRIDPSKKEIIAEYIDKHFCEHDEVPSVRDIVEGTGIPLSTVHRYLISMREDGSLDYSGRRTARTKLMEDAAPIHALQVLGTVACGPGQEEEQRFITLKVSCKGMRNIEKNGLAATLKEAQKKGYVNLV